MEVKLSDRDVRGIKRVLQAKRHIMLFDITNMCPNKVFQIIIQNVFTW